MPDDNEVTRPELLDSKQAAARFRTVSRGSLTVFLWMIGVQSVVILLLLAAVGYLLVASAQSSADMRETVTQAIMADDQRWCSTVDLLTAQPVSRPTDPSANPSREESYDLYIDFVTLRKQFHCE